MKKKFIISFLLIFIGVLALYICLSINVSYYFKWGVLLPNETKRKIISSIESKDCKYCRGKSHDTHIYEIKYSDKNYKIIKKLCPKISSEDIADILNSSNINNCSSDDCKKYLKKALSIVDNGSCFLVNYKVFSSKDGKFIKVNFKNTKDSFDIDSQIYEVSIIVVNDIEKKVYELHSY